MTALTAAPPGAQTWELFGPQITTANDRLKEGYATRFWGSMIIAILLHVALFALWPELTAADYSIPSSELEIFELPPEIEIPPPPEAIARPATPVMASADIDEEITIAPTTFRDNPVEALPPPPTSAAAEAPASAPYFTPMTVEPGIKNRRAVEQALEREYPPLLRDAGIGGTVLVWFYINENGVVEETQVNTSSGHAALDEAALRVAEVIEFSPALNREKRVAVWISLPITFQIRR